MSIELKNRLDSLSWPELKKTAAIEYGVKVLPEYNAESLKQFILAKVTSDAATFVTDTVPIAAKDNKSGWSRVRIIKGPREKDTHCRACHNGYQFAIPFNVDVNLPTVTAEYLETKKEPKFIEESEAGNLLGGLVDGSGLESRWTVVILEKNYGPNGERGFIPASERGKYLNREAKLAPKRQFFDQFGFWPTDKRLKEYMQAGMFNYMRRAEA